MAVSDDDQVDDVQDGQDDGAPSEEEYEIESILDSKRSSSGPVSF